MIWLDLSHVIGVAPIWRYANCLVRMGVSEIRVRVFHERLLVATNRLGTLERMERYERTAIGVCEDAVAQWHVALERVERAAIMMVARYTDRVEADDASRALELLHERARFPMTIRRWAVRLPRRDVAPVWDDLALDDTLDDTLEDGHAPASDL